MSGVRALVRGNTRGSSFSLHHVRAQRKDRLPPQEPNHDGSLISDSRPPELGTIKIHYLGATQSVALSEQPG